MKSVDAVVKTAIRNGYDVKALPRLTAEWNMNRYSTPVVTNNPAESVAGNDVDMFPIESIVEPLRPTKGINKARVNYGTISDSYQTPTMPRFYVASLEDKYKYWVSPYASDGAGNISGVAPQIVYPAPVKTNKIVVGVENSWASPSAWNIQTSTDGGGTWTTASSSPVLGADGRAVLYWNGTNWSSTRPSVPAAPTTISGIKVNVSKLTSGMGTDNRITQANTRFGLVNTTGGASYFSLIEIGARLEMDLTANLENVSDTFDAGDTSQVTPIGTITSNSAQLSLWNGDSVLSNQLVGMMEPNVKMNLEYVYEVAGVKYPVQQFSMFTEGWNEDEESSIAVELTDGSKFLKEIYPMEAKYEDQTLAQIVYRLLDSVGYTDYNVVNHGYINDFKIPIFWVDGEETIWEVLDELATATQSLIYFDAWGRLNVRSRENAYDPARAVDWTLLGNSTSTALADIVSLEKSGEYSPNVITVNYKKVEWAPDTNGFVQMSTVWQPEGTTVLRSTPLLNSLGAAGNIFVISPAEAVHWPYEGAVQIEGEFIGFKGKQFNYRTSTGAWAQAWVNDEKEYEKLDQSTPVAYRGHNNFSGQFRIDERGAWNTTAANHTPEAKGWEHKRFNYNADGNAANVFNSSACWQWFWGQSMVRLSGNGELQGMNQWATSTRFAASDAPYRQFGTRFRFNGAGLHQRGGICFNVGGDGNGYYIECRPTNTIENKDRDTQDEITIYSIHGVSIKQMKNNVKYHDLIVADTWHDLEVYFEPNDHRISIWLDGKKIMTDNITPSNYRHARTNRFGMFIRGQTNMDFEYFYALTDDVPELVDDVSFLDRVRGNYVSNVWQNDIVSKTRTKSRWVKRKGKKTKQNYEYKSTNFMDEFGPFVHEVREFDIKFDPAPVQFSKLYFTNDWQVVCPEFRSDAFGAYFILSNASRSNAVVSGSDDLSFAVAGASVDQQLLVYGRALVEAEEEKVEVRNEPAIRSRGEIVAEVDSRWLQSESAAQAVADWISAHWSTGADEIEVEVFGNPLFEVGDRVDVESLRHNMTAATHQYFVTNVETSFEAGIETHLTLRRKN